MYVIFFLKILVDKCAKNVVIKTNENIDVESSGTCDDTEQDIFDKPGRNLKLNFSKLLKCKNLNYTNSYEDKHIIFNR